MCHVQIGGYTAEQQCHVRHHDVRTICLPVLSPQLGDGDKLVNWNRPTDTANFHMLGNLWRRCSWLDMTCTQDNLFQRQGPHDWYSASHAQQAFKREGMQKVYMSWHVNSREVPAYWIVSEQAKVT